MAQARFHSLRGEKKTTALILVKANAFQFNSDPVYVPAAAVADAVGVENIEDLQEGDTFELPEGYSFEEMVDSRTGEVMTAGDGSPLHQLAYN